MSAYLLFFSSSSGQARRFGWRLMLLAFAVSGLSVLGACSRDTDPASRALKAAAGRQESGAAPVVASRPPSAAANRVHRAETELSIERVRSRSTDVAAVNAGLGTRINFKLTDTDGELASLSSFEGKVVALVFGATRCAQSCQGALARLHLVQARAGLRSSQVAFVMVSVDGDHDTPKVLRQFVSRMSPNVIGLTGAPQAVADLAAKFNIHDLPHGAGAPDTPLHSSPVILIDGQGFWRKTVSSSGDAGSLIEAILPMVKESATRLSGNAVKSR